MRFAFAGIDFLGDVFETLLARGWEPVKLFSRPCDSIYDFNDVTLARARALKLPVQMSRILPADLAGLRTLGCDALVVAGYPWLVTGWERYLPYAVNFHPSPLPMGRGPYPLFQAILDDLPEWGMTVHVLDPSFDTGAIVAQKRFSLSAAETHDTLLAKCQMAAKAIAVGLVEDLPGLYAEARPQGPGTYWPRITQSLRTVAQVDSRYIYVWDATGWEEPHRYRPGTLVHRHRKHLLVAVRDGFVQVTGWSPYAPGPARGK
jgi:methionyl-tRNA formyltransferase